MWLYKKQKIDSIDDMPKGTYNSFNKALKNARLILKKTRCDAVKIEHYKDNFKILKYLVQKKIPVMGHIGYTPQFKNKFKLYTKSFSVNNLPSKVGIMVNTMNMIQCILISLITVNHLH